MGATRARLPGGRLHFQHGPIDIVIGADGDARALREAGLCHDAILVCQGWVVDAAGTPRRLAPPRASPDAAPVALAVHA